MEIPAFWWQLPTPILLILLLSLGVFVTKRENNAMKELMIYFRDLNEKKDTVIANQAESLKAYKELVAPVTALIKVSREKATEDKDVS